MVADLLARNGSHKGQLQALAWIDELMARASANERAFKGAEELARLRRNGVTPLQVLTELAAVTVYLRTHPRTVLSDLAWDFAVSAAIFKLSPRPRRVTRGPGGYWPVSGKVDHTRTYSPKPRPSALRYVGRHLRETLAALLANIHNTLEATDKVRQATEAELSAPLVAF